MFKIGYLLLALIIICAVRTWNCRNIEFLNVHNYSQITFTSNFIFYDINKDLDVRPWEFTKLTITGNESREDPLSFETGNRNQLQCCLMPAGHPSIGGEVRGLPTGYIPSTLTIRRERWHSCRRSRWVR
jgi:hypothetical protein